MTEGHWHSVGTDSVLKYWSTDKSAGLSTARAQERFAKVGPNRIEEEKGESAFSRFIGQFKDLMILILIAAAIISGLLREWLDTIAILAIVILNGILGFVQEERAQKALAALKKLTAPTAKVIRVDSRRLTARASAPESC